VPVRCKPCLSEEVKAAIRERVRDPAVLRVLEVTPACEGDELMELCLKKGRKPSAYQEFVGECLRRKKVAGFDDAPGKMKECAAEWQAHKEG
jgi:hypothetical protein